MATVSFLGVPGVAFDGWLGWTDETWLEGITYGLYYTPAPTYLPTQDAQLLQITSGPMTGRLVRLMGPTLSQAGNFGTDNPLPFTGTIEGLQIFDRYEDLLIFDDPNNQVLTQTFDLWDGQKLVEVTGLNIDASTLQGVPDLAATLMSVLAGGPDDIYGSAEAELLVGAGGWDTVRGGDGNDTLRGEDGYDLLYGNAGEDSILAGMGNDTVLGGTGADIIRGDNGNDSLMGEGQNDTIFGGQGGDVIRGGDGNDSLLGELGNDTISGDRGSDFINAGSGFDLVYGGDGNDTILGQAGDDILNGAAGSDELTGGTGNDSLYGGNGTDTLIGNSGNDYLHGGAHNDLLSGGDHADTLIGGDGADELIGGNGGDQLTGGLGPDAFVFQALSHFSAAAPDTITDFVSGVDTIVIKLDADLTTAGIQPFTYLGVAPIGGAGTLRYNPLNQSLEGEVDGVAGIDVMIRIAGGVVPVVGDFIFN